MRSIAAFTVLLSIFVSGAMPGYAQLVRRSPKKVVESTESRRGGSAKEIEDQPAAKAKATPAVHPGKKFDRAPVTTKFSKVESFTEGQGAWVRWRMEVEKANAGFRVYRQSNSGRTPISEFILGSLFTYGNQAFTDGEYSFFDRKGSASSTYVVEAVAENGETLLSNSVAPTLVSELGSVKGGDQMRVESLSVKPGENMVESSLSVSPELQAEIVAGQITPDPVKHLEVISQPGARITSKADGLVRVTKDQLAAAGFNVNSDPTTWQLYLQGVELPIIVGPNADYIEFLGKGLDTLESDIRAYYLIEGTIAGRRITGQAVRRPLSTVISRKYDQTFVRRDRTSYTNQVLNGPAENWWGQSVTNVSSNLNFSLSAVDRTAGTRRMTLVFQGFSASNHNVSLTLNGNPIGNASGTFGRSKVSGEFDVPVEWLLDGNNVLAMTANGATGDIVFFESLSIDLPRAHVAQGTSQVETMTASGTAKAPGTVTVVVNSAYLPNAPISVDVELAGNETSTLQGQLYRNALAANPTISNRYLISGSGSSVVLTDKVKAADDPMLRLTVSDTDSTGINQVTFSANTVKGVESRLMFQTENYKNAIVSGFANPNVRVFDVTYEASPRVLTNLESRETNGTWGPVIPAGRERVLYAVEDGVFDAPHSVTANDTEKLGVPTHGATMLLISHPEFLPQAEIWAQYRSGQGITTKVVDVTEIYDEYSYGVLSSQAIEAFLNYAKYNWQTPPSYVMLFGEAHYDSRNFTGRGYWNMVPSRLVDTLYTETGSDEALADFNNDGLAEIPIGRASSRDAAGITALFNKTVAWEAVLTPDSLNRGALFAHDVAGDYDFLSMSTRIMSKLPESMPKTLIGKTSPTAQADIVAAVNFLDGGTPELPGPNAGEYLLNYTGHGSAAAWENLGFFSVCNVIGNVCDPVRPQLTNEKFPSMIIALTCLNGYFMGNVNTFAEAMTNASGGGGVAVWASTGLTTPDVQEILANRFYSSLSEGSIQRMGDLIADAKAHVPAGADVRLSWALLGDPMLKVR